jgi:hypothetical protein
MVSLQYAISHVFELPQMNRTTLYNESNCKVSNLSEFSNECGDELIDGRL